MPETYVIVGAGQAAGQLAVSLRSEGFEGRIVMVGEESYNPYQRPPLSKQFLAGEVGLERVTFRPPEFYAKANIELLLATRVDAINRDRRTIKLRDERELAYDKLALATGSRVRRLELPGADLAGVLYLRTIADVNALQPHLVPDKKLVIVGGGYIGLEVAAVAIKRGVAVTVLEMDARVMNRVVTPTVSDFYAAVHRDAGVDLRTGVCVAGFSGDNGQLTHVHAANGDSLAADVALIAVGIVPNCELAAAAGLAVDDGIVVDEFACTGDPAIVAAGDCTKHPNSHLAQQLRLESVHNALAQARTAAATLCGNEKPYAEMPWFWSDQYDLKMQILGLSQGCDHTVVRGDVNARSFSVFCFKNDKLIAVESVNNPKEFLLCKKHITAPLALNEKQLADSSVALPELLTQHTQ